MTQHILQGRSEDEMLWFRRRSFLQAAAAWTALGGWSAALAQQRSNIVELLGDVRLNGERLRPEQFIQTGDRIETGPDGQLLFVMNDSAFLVRRNSHLVVERGGMLTSVSVLRLLTGAVVSVWRRGDARQVVTPTLTAGIRGTGVYTEVGADGRSYFCNCYGAVDLSAGGERVRSRADYHQSFWAEVQPRNGHLLTPAAAINHSDEELERVAAMLGQRTRWQELGRKGVKDGAGSMDAGRPHPLAPGASR